MLLIAILHPKDIFILNIKKSIKLA